MKFVIASDHREFFQKHHSIEFDELLNSKQLAQLNSAIDETLAERLHDSIADLASVSSGKLFMAGHDLWRSNTQVKKVVTSKQFAEVAIDLTEQRALRLGCDQLFPELKGRIYKSAVSDAYHQLLDLNTNLQGISSFDGVCCGLMLCLKGEGSESADMDSIFSKKPGNGVFFHTDFPINFQHLKKYPLHRYLLIVYVKNNAAYKRNDNDPHTHSLKQFDYIFDERLKDKFHPMVYR